MASMGSEQTDWACLAQRFANLQRRRAITERNVMRALLSCTGHLTPTQMGDVSDASQIHDEDIPARLAPRVRVHPKPEALVLLMAYPMKPMHALPFRAGNCYSMP